MTEDWIQKLADKQRQREQKRVDEESAKDASQRDFDRAAAPFFTGLYEEAARLVGEFNEAIGREDLSITALNESSLGRDSFAIHRGDGRLESCRVSLYTKGKRIDVARKPISGGPDAHNINLHQDDDGIHAGNAEGGSPAATAKEIFESWAHSFRPVAPDQEVV